MPVLFYFLLILIVATVVLLPTLVGWGLSFLFRSYMLCHIAVRWTGIAASVLTAIALAYGFTLGARHIVVSSYRYSHSLIPQAFDGYHIVQLSDWHLGTFGKHPEFVREVVRQVNAQEPDLIVFTGDLVNRESAEAAQFEEVLGKLKAKDGVMSVMGNHDYMFFAHDKSTRQRLSDVGRLQSLQRRLGWQLLLNEHILLHRGADSIAIIGVENDGDGKHFPQYGNLPKAMEGLSPQTFSVLLSHDPTHWRRKVLEETDIPLQLSGHTHAMQMKCFGWSPSSWIYPEWYGRYDENTALKADGWSGASAPHSCKRTLIVSSGIGSVAIPFRLGAWPEVVVITLHRN